MQTKGPIQGVKKETMLFPPPWSDNYNPNISILTWLEPCYLFVQNFYVYGILGFWKYWFIFYFSHVFIMWTGLSIENFSIFYLSIFFDVNSSLDLSYWKCSCNILNFLPCQSCLLFNSNWALNHTNSDKLITSMQMISSFDIQFQLELDLFIL